MSLPSATITIMLRAAEKAAKSLLRDFGEVEHLQVSRKGPGDFVSAADRRAEEIIYTELKKARPSFGFLMEEGGEIAGTDGEFRFIIDPLDGTINFLHALPHWNISIGLERGNEIIAGLVMDPAKNEVFYAEKGTGAFLDKRRLRVSTRKDLETALVAGEREKTFVKNLTACNGRLSGMRGLGAAALDLCYVASGRYEAFWGTKLKPWDVAAGSLIVREAGGLVVSLKGDPNPVYADKILSSNAALHQTFKDLLTANVTGE